MRIRSAAIKSALFLISPPELPGILVIYLELTLFAISVFLLIAVRSSAAALLASGGLWLLAQLHPDLLPRLADHSYFNPFAWQFIFCIGMFVGTWYNSDISLEPFRRPPWVLLACTVVASGLLFRIARVYASGHHLDLGHVRMVGRDAGPNERELIGDPPCALSQRCLPRRDFRQADQSNSSLAWCERHHQQRPMLAAGVLRRRGLDRPSQSIHCRRGATRVGTAHPRLPGNHADRIDGDSLDEIASRAQAGWRLFCRAQFDDHNLIVQV